MSTTNPPLRFVIRNGWLITNGIRIRLSLVKAYMKSGDEVRIFDGAREPWHIATLSRDGEVWGSGAAELIAALDEYFATAATPSS